MRLVCLILVLLLCPPALAQRRRGPLQPGTTNRGSYDLPPVTFHGVLKELTGKLMVIENEEGQPVTIYRSHKTKFLRGDSAIDPKQIESGTKLTIDVSKNPDASLLAVNVIVSQ